MADHFARRLAGEFERRATRPRLNGVLGLTATFLAPDFVEEASRMNVSRMMEFCEHDVIDRTCLEIGAGVGRVTEQLVQRARQLSVLELDGTMLKKNRRRLGFSAGKVNDIHGMLQHQTFAERFDVVLVSQVLIHQTDDKAFTEFVDVVSACSDRLYLFENVYKPRRTSSATRIRIEEELFAPFIERGFLLEARDYCWFFEDLLVFACLAREAAPQDFQRGRGNAIREDGDEIRGDGSSETPHRRPGPGRSRRTRKDRL